jgi:putative glucoamylase/uncharacterized protein DUF3131
MKKIIVFTMVALIAILAIAKIKELTRSHPSISRADREYLQTIMKETWNYLDGHLADKTGFPSDSQTGGGNTNTTNIGLYLASVGPAYKLGYLSREDALQRISKIIASVNRLEGKRGFYPNWVDVGGKTAISEGVLATSDFNKLITGLILVRQVFPELSKEATAIIDRVEWERLYDSKSKDTYWGYDLKKDLPVGKGRFFLASDCRLVVFYMIASGAVPSEVWGQTHQGKIHADGLEFFEPGYHLGGLFMQAIDAIFLNDMTTEAGCSIADLAWHQIREADRMGLKAWGWSNCNVPGKGYTEGGFLPWWVVTPHASALVIERYPQHVIANLRQLESMGLRKPLISNTPYGFRDSVDLKTGLVDDRYLCLDQAMLFLSLVNYTEDGMVRKFFAADPLVKSGLKKLEKHFVQKPELLKKWAQRDASKPVPVVMPPKTPKEIVLDFTQENNLPVLTSAWGGGKIETKQSPKGLLVNFDLSAEDKCEVEFKFQFPPIDARELNEIQITCSAVSKDDFGGIRVYLFDDQGLSQYSYVDGICSETQTFTIAASDRFGILARPQAVNSLAIKLWKKPWYFHSQDTKANSGQLIIQKISLK